MHTLRLPWRVQDPILFVQRLRRALASAGMDKQAARFLAHDLQNEIREFGMAMRLIPGSEVGRTDSDQLRVDVVVYDLNVLIRPPKLDAAGEIVSPAVFEERGLHADVCFSSSTINVNALTPVFSAHMRAMPKLALPVPEDLLKEGWREVEAPTDDDGTALLVAPLAVPRRYYPGIDPEPTPILPATEM